MKRRRRGGRSNKCLFTHIAGVRVRKMSGEEPGVLILLNDREQLFEADAKDECLYYCGEQEFEDEKPVCCDASRAIGILASMVKGVDCVWFRRNDGIRVIMDYKCPEAEQRVELLARILLQRARVYKAPPQIVSD